MSNYWLDQRANAHVEAMESLIDRLHDALIFCSGSPDFAPGGRAEGGWDKVCRPVLSDMQYYYAKKRGRPAPLKEATEPA